MRKQERKSIKINEEHYEILKDYGESKGISMSESIAEMQKDIDFLKSQTLTTISENAKMFCDQGTAWQNVEGFLLGLLMLSRSQ